MFKDKFKGKMIFELNRVLATLNIQIQPLGRGFRSAKETIRLAKSSGRSLNDFLESLAMDNRNLGQRDRVMERISNYCSTNMSVIEIGSGSMRYSDSLVSHTSVLSYEIYETQKDWRDFAKSNPCFQQIPLAVHIPNGRNLSQSKPSSADLIHAHGVFVYLTFLETIDYLADAARVLKTNGFLIFDVFDIESLEQQSISDWLLTPHRWPTFLSISKLIDHLSGLDLVLVDRFQEFYGASEVTYLVFTKK